MSLSSSGSQDHQFRLHLNRSVRDWPSGGSCRCYPANRRRRNLYFHHKHRRRRRHLHLPGLRWPPSGNCQIHPKRRRRLGPHRRRRLHRRRRHRIGRHLPPGDNCPPGPTNHLRQGLHRTGPPFRRHPGRLERHWRCLGSYQCRRPTHLHPDRYRYRKDYRSRLHRSRFEQDLQSAGSCRARQCRRRPLRGFEVCHRHPNHRRKRLLARLDQDLPDQS